MSKIVELFGHRAVLNTGMNWPTLIADQQCPYIGRKCLKTRKSQSEIAIGTCSVTYGRKAIDIIICPIRLLERRQVFIDCIHLLTLHEPGNELHILGEITIPGGNVDYFLVSARGKRVIDFVAIEWQTLDTTGTVWPERQRFAASAGTPVSKLETENPRTFGMNWKMTAKTILVQLHHKVQTFEGLNKHLVLVVQDHLLTYMQRAFAFDHLEKARLGDPMHIHSYKLSLSGADYRLRLDTRLSTDSAGIAACLGLQASPKVELSLLIEYLESRISDLTLLRLDGPIPDIGTVPTE
jgi:Restriction endonuclease NotI